MDVAHRHLDLYMRVYAFNLDALLLVRALGLEVGLVVVGALHAQEAVGGVTDAAGQHPVSQHGIDHCALPITRPIRSNVLYYNDYDDAYMQPNILTSLLTPATD